MLQRDNRTLCLVVQYPDYYYMLFCQLVKGYLTLFCVILGTVGNLHGIKSIHLSNFDKNRGVVLAASLISLAFWDTILLWCAVFYYSIGALLRPYNIEMPTMIIPWFQGCAQISLTASVWCVAAITVQRWWASRDPFRGSRSSRVLLNTVRNDGRSSSLSVIYCYTYRKHFKMPVILSSLAIIVNLPAFFELTSIDCVLDDGSYSTMLIYWLRGYDYYVLWYRVIFRSIMSTIGPNIFIFTITLWTILLIRGSNRSRRRLFQLRDDISDRCAFKETIQTVISLMLATKFLLLRMPLFILDILEVAGFWSGSFMYASDLSNFLVVANSATNCVIYLKAASWLEQKIERRNTSLKRRCAFEALQTSRRIDLLENSWQKIKKTNVINFGVHIMYTILCKSPQLAVAIGLKESSRQCDPERQEELMQEYYDSLLASPRIRQLGSYIVNFIENILEQMNNGLSEEEIAAKIRHVAIIHNNRNIVFTSSVWREFKNAVLGYLQECPYDSDVKRRETIAAWNSFISMVIREMKKGIWQIEDEQLAASSTFRRYSVAFNPND